MAILRLRLLPIILLVAFFPAIAQTVTLYPPMDRDTKKYNEGKACFSFKYGLLKEVVKGPCEFGYGFLSVSEEDWFTIPQINGVRTVMKDLGEHQWNEEIAVPVLEPLPEQPKGKPRDITVDASADTHKKWAAQTSIAAKVAIGHIYLVHVKDETADFYAMVRVEELEQQKHCTISWRLVPTPKPQKPEETP
jgi:hypothetical protein